METWFVILEICGRTFRWPPGEGRPFMRTKHADEVRYGSVNAETREAAIDAMRLTLAVDENERACAATTARLADVKRVSL